MARTRCWLATTVAILMTTGVALAQDQQAKTFLTEAIEGNFAEVQLGQLAQKNGANQGVRAFGQLLEQDHSAANQKARTAANAMQVPSPTQPNSKQKADYEHLSKLNGPAFDSQFVDHMVKDHEEDIQKYEKAATMTNAAGIYAKEELPTLRKHLETAQSLKSATTGVGR
jgi:putative membrane protein